MIDELIKLIQEYNNLQPLEGNKKKKLDEKFRLEFNFNSNHLEGNTLTYGETKLLLMSDLTKGNHELREYEEMKAHDVALIRIKQEAEDIERPLTERFIKELNEIILIRPFWKDAQTSDGQATRRKIKIGEYKEYPNSVIQTNGEIFEYSSPQETPFEMAKLVNWYNNEAQKKELLPIELASVLHYRYIRIHPFDDGNGRTARLLVNYVLLKNGLPPLIVKTEDKKNYLYALQQADAGDFQAFIDYMVKQLIWSLELSIKAARGESIEDQDDWEKKLTLLKKRLGDKETEVISKSEEILETLYKDVINVFIDLYEKKISQFDNFFMSKFINYSIHDDIFDNFIPEGREKIFSMAKIEILNLDINIIFKNLRNPYTNIDFKIPISFSFGENAYAIKYLNTIITKLYNDFLTEEEMNEIISEIANDLLNKIDKIVQNNNE